MKRECAACNQPYTEASCEIFQCPYHGGNCFYCKQCKEGIEEDPPESEHLLQCSLCPQISPIEDFYFDFQCETYICYRHFQKCDLTFQQITLPCGCMTDDEQVYTFMINFCIQCNRKMTNRSFQGYGCCEVCEKQLSLSQIMEKNQLGQQFNEFQSKRLMDAQLFKYIENLEETVKTLNVKLKDINEKYLISEQARKQLVGLLQQDDFDKVCPICSLPYNLEQRKPMTICFRQHQICNECLAHPNITKCTFCPETIPKADVLVTRSKIKSLKLAEMQAKDHEQQPKIKKKPLTQKRLNVIKRPRRSSRWGQKKIIVKPKQNGVMKSKHNGVMSK